MNPQHFKATFRKLKRNFLSTSFVLVGLSLGIGTFFLTLQWGLWHFSYDRDIPRNESIYRLTVEESQDGFYRHTARVLQGEFLKDLLNADSLPYIRHIGRLAPFMKASFKVDEITFYEEHAYACDPSILEILKPPVILGNFKRLLEEPRTAVITHSMARKYFGNENPLGREIELLHQFDVVAEKYTIRAVIQDFPINSHLEIDILTSFLSSMDYKSSAWTYVELFPGADPGECEAQIKLRADDFFEVHKARSIAPHLQALTDIHLRSALAREIKPNMPLRTVIIILVSGLLVFLLAWFNFTLLNVSQNRLSVKKLTIRWQMGAGRKDFFRFFLADILVNGGLALLAGILLSLLFLKGKLVPEALSIPFQAKHFLFSLAVLLIFLLGSALGSAGISTSRLYIYLQHSFLSGHPGAASLPGRRNLGIRATVIFEFVITFVLISNLLMLARQTSFAMDQQLGSQQSSALHIHNLHRSIIDSYGLFRDRMLENSAIATLTASMEEPTGQAMDANRFSIDGVDVGEKKIFLFPAEENLFRFYELEILHGMDMPLVYNPEDTVEYFILNQSAAKMISDDPSSLLGRELRLHFDFPGLIWPGPIRGIVEDFHFSGLQEQINPMVIFPKHTWLYCFSILPAGDVEAAIQHMERVWKELFPDFPLEYQSSEELIDGLYGNELEQIHILIIFCILSLFIAGMGLFALSSIFMQRRMKSTALRKINGAGMWILVRAELLHYLGLALFSSALAVPASLFLMERWMRDFHYRTPLPIWIFPACALALILISWCSVLYHSIRLSMIKPVEFLKEQ